MRRILIVVLAGAAALAATRRPTDDRTLTHVLNRVAFGPRAGDVERVRRIRIERYIDEQLHPDRIADSAVEMRLASLQSLTKPSSELAGDRRAAVVGELAEQKLLRGIYSERQLQEVLVDFWFNHFNVDARKGPVRFMIAEYERETIRPHVLGRFRDLLEATAKSPAMLFYLDNWMSVDPNVDLSASIRRAPAGDGARPRRGLNENYARELMELHTLGVDGGYTQADVTEVARAFTGWTIDQPRQGGGFVFRPRLHDEGEKVVLGHVITRGGGESDGEQVLDILATHPSTATFIAKKLVRRFVSDDPPAALVTRAAKRFRETTGDLREVVRTILRSNEFLSPRAFDAKVKTPFEFVVSAVRTTGAEIADARPLVRTLRELGMPLYECQPPTGYKDTTDAWISTGALVERLTLAVRFARGDETLASALGSPEFQRR